MTSKWERAGPDALRPMMAVTGTLPTRDTGWAYEMKWDGIRALAHVSGGRLRLTSRTGRDVSLVYPELAGLGGAVRAARAVLDGEIVAFGDGEWPDFESLQQRMNISSPAQARVLAAQVPVSYLAFDLLWLDDDPLLDQPYAQRRALLDGLAIGGGNWQAPPSFTGESGKDMQAVSRQHDLEGIMAKRLQSRYEPGRRSASWVKIKNIRRQEVVIGGWKAGEGGRAGGIGSLLVGVQGEGGLVYCGHVGSGFTQQTLRMLSERLGPLRRATSPFAAEIPAEEARSSHWVEPVLVADVAFGSWTSSGRLRGPSYKGLRDDKDPAEVVREP
ncbi:MAG TPA: non-homologous end-joining DNA ligase [Streptosporangiaceae bacterium]|nr:non-homologous end-joining DNA ligase [Streptosporangiaceae bacterium]